MNLEIINDKQPAKRTGGGRAFHSRLEPFVEFIREQRQQRKTWKEIAAVLSSGKACPITAQGVHQFYRRYVRRRANGHWEDESPNPARCVIDWFRNGAVMEQRKLKLQKI